MASRAVPGRADGAPAVDPAVLTGDLVETAERAARLEVRSFEERDLESIRHELVPTVRDMVERGLDAIGRVLAAYDPPGSRRARDVEPSGGESFATVDPAMGADGWDAHVADLAFMARMELRDKLAELRGVDSASDPWRVLAVCYGCIRRLCKAAAAVETAVSDHAGIEPRLQFLSEARLAQVVRASYARFRREIERGSAPSDDTIHTRLLSAAASIAKLIGQDFYSDLRVGDRAELRALQGRLRFWLRGEDGHDAESGLRLWQDLHGFAVLLAQINRRSELVEHDLAIVRYALDELTSDGGAPVELPSALLQQLRRLEGRSDRIDGLLTDPMTRAAAPWIAELQSLDETLSAMDWS